MRDPSDLGDRSFADLEQDGFIDPVTVPRAERHDCDSLVGQILECPVVVLGDGLGVESVERRLEFSLGGEDAVAR